MSHSGTLFQALPREPGSLAHFAGRAQALAAASSHLNTFLTGERRCFYLSRSALFRFKSLSKLSTMDAIPKSQTRCLVTASYAKHGQRKTSQKDIAKRDGALVQLMACYSLQKVLTASLSLKPSRLYLDGKDILQTVPGLFHVFIVP